MGLFAKSKPATLYRAFLKGRLRSVGLLDDKEARQYTDQAAPVPMLVAFVLGALAEGDQLPTESDVELLVKERLGYVPPSKPGVGLVEVRLGGGRGGDGGAAPAAAAARWIGEPLAPTPSPTG